MRHWLTGRPENCKRGEVASKRQAGTHEIARRDEALARLVVPAPRVGLAIGADELYDLGMWLAPRLLLLFLLGASSVAFGQEERRFPQAKISVEQWQTYFDEVKSKSGTQIREVSEFTIIEVREELELFVFTKPVHPAHPAAIHRRVFNKDGAFYVTTNGYYAGSQAAFDPLFAWYKQADVKMREDIERQRAGKTPAEPSRP
jgi:hypothetical protein